MDSFDGQPARYPSTRGSAYADNLKVVLVAGVIVAHATMAWTGVGTWVFDEPHVREPLLTLAILLEVIGAMFGMALFFFIAGVFTPRSLARKGLGRFLADRVVRLGVPMVFFMLALSPLVEYVDPENAGWNEGFARFAVHIWWPPVPGPTWFLGVLLLFSAVYAVLRTVWPRRTAGATPPRAWQLAIAASVVALASYAVRIVVPLGEERWHLALGQAPAWVFGLLSAFLRPSVDGSTRSSHRWRAASGTSRGPRWWGVSSSWASRAPWEQTLTSSAGLALGSRW